MIQLVALIVLGILYVIPLNLVLYGFSEKTAQGIVTSNGAVAVALRRIPSLADGVKSHPTLSASVLYVLYVAIIFTGIYYLLKLFVFKSLYVFWDNEVEKETFLVKYQYGQRNLNHAANVAMLIVIIVLLCFRKIDVRLLVMAFLCMEFIFRDHDEGRGRNGESSRHEQEDAVKIDGKELVFDWTYDPNPLSMQDSIRFHARVPYDPDRYVQYQLKEHMDNSDACLRRYVIDGLCPEVVELAGRIKDACTDRGLTAYHQVCAVMAFQQALSYVNDLESKGREEYVRYPLETLVDKKGDCDCHAICSAAILYSMGYDVVLLKMAYAEGDGHLAIAVEGADGLQGNFFRHDGRKYYYCEVTPSQGNSMNFRVGEMPDMQQARVTVIPVKEFVSGM